MPNSQGTITATTPPAGGAGDTADSGLPDASFVARIWLAIFLIAALALAYIWNQSGPHAAFDPSKEKAANFALFAGFYVGAQVIERLLEVVSPLIPKGLPGWSMPTGVTGDAAQAAQVKADRAKVVLGLATVLGVAASCGFGLYFLQAVGIDTTRWIDIVATGLTISAGTKPLHDFITSLQNKSTPTTGTGANLT